MVGGRVGHWNGCARTNKAYVLVGAVLTPLLVGVVGVSHIVTSVTFYHCSNPKKWKLPTTKIAKRA